MRARDVVGKRIARVKQSKFFDPEYGRIVSIDSLILENGTIIVFHTCPTVDQPVPTASLIKIQKKRVKE